MSNDFISDISETWNDPIEVQDDVRNFLMNMYSQTDGADDFKIEDMIEAIESGIRDFRKISKM
jgi:hypothetical protein